MPVMRCQIISRELEEDRSTCLERISREPMVSHSWLIEHGRFGSAGYGEVKFT
jgi:hypothetical protein